MQSLQALSLPSVAPVPVHLPVASPRPPGPASLPPGPVSLLAVLDQVVDETLTAAGIIAPPIAPRELAGQLGLARLEPSELRAGVVRRLIGAALLPQTLDRLHRRAEDLTAAQARLWTRALAQRLALPTAWFERDGMALDWNLPELARRYRCSPVLVARRMLSMSTDLTITIFADNWLIFRESRPQQVRPLSAGELSCRAQILATGRPADLQRAGERVQGWAFRHGSRTREVLRTTRCD